MMTQLVAMLVMAAPTPLESAGLIEPIGWSEAGHVVALRVFYGSERFDQLPCPGYVDANGKPFLDGLAIVVLRDEVVLHSFVIQAPVEKEKCTPIAVAKERLEQAKKAMDELGIDRTAPGAVLSVTSDITNVTARKTNEALTTHWKETWRAQDQEAMPLEVVVSQTDVDDSGYHTRKVSMQWTLKLGESERKGTQKLKPIEWSESMVGTFALKLKAFASPDRAGLIAFVVDHHSNMRGGWSTTRLLSLAAPK